MIVKPAVLALALLAAPGTAAAAAAGNAWIPVGPVGKQFVFRQPDEKVYPDGSRELAIIGYAYTTYLEPDGRSTTEFETSAARFRVDCDWMASWISHGRIIGKDGLGVLPDETLETANLTPGGNLVDDFATKLTHQVCDPDAPSWPQRLDKTEAIEAFAKDHLPTPPVKHPPLRESARKLLGPKPPPPISVGSPAETRPKPVPDFPHALGADWRLVSRYGDGQRSMYVDTAHIARTHRGVFVKALQVYPSDYSIPYIAAADAALLNLGFDCEKRTVSVTGSLDWGSSGGWPDSMEWYLFNLPMKPGGAMEAAWEVACQGPPAGPSFTDLRAAYDDALRHAPAPRN